MQSEALLRTNASKSDNGIRFVGDLVSVLKGSMHRAWMAEDALVAFAC